MVLSEKTGRLVEAFFLQRGKFLKTASSEPSHVLAYALSEVLMFYANDKNSSALREWFVLRIAGCSPRKGKIGYNGFKDNVPYEVKPRNVQKGERQKKKLNGDGNFTDLTYERIEKYLRDGVQVLVTGFVDGIPVYILEVPFECLHSVLKHQLDKKFSGSRPTGMFLRSANFSFRDYQSSYQVKCLFLNQNWREFSEWLNREFQCYLERFERSERGCN